MECTAPEESAQVVGARITPESASGGWRRAAEKASDNRDQQQHEEDVEENTRNIGRRSCDAGEAEEAGDKCDNQKSNDPAKHDGWVVSDEAVAAGMTV